MEIAILLLTVLIFIVNILILARLLSNNNTNITLAEFVSLITIYAEFLYQIQDKNKPINEIKKEIYDIIINNIDKHNIARKLNISIDALEIIVAGIIDKTINDS